MKRGKIIEAISGLFIIRWIADLRRKLQKGAHRFAYFLVQCLGICTRLRSFLYAKRPNSSATFVNFGYSNFKRSLIDHLGRSGFIERKAPAIRLVIL